MTSADRLIFIAEVLWRIAEPFLLPLAVSVVVIIIFNLRRRGA